MGNINCRTIIAIKHRFTREGVRVTIAGLLTFSNLFMPSPLIYNCLIEPKNYREKIEERTNRKSLMLCTGETFAIQILANNESRCLFRHGSLESVIYHEIKLPVFTKLPKVNRFKLHLFI